MEFANEEPLRQLSLDLERSYASAFTYGFLGLAHKELSPPELNIYDYISMAFRLGMCFLMLVWLIWDYTFSPPLGVNLFERPIISLYGACGGIILMLWFWGLNLVVWERAKIDYISLLDFDPMKTYSAIDIFTEVSVASTVLMINLLLYYKMLRGEGGKGT